MAIENIKRVFKKRVFLYNDCSDLPIYNFDKIYNTQDLKYLVVSYDGYKSIDIPIGAKQRWVKIFDEWVKLCDSSTMFYYYQLLSQVAYLEIRYLVVKVMLYQMYSRDMSDKTLDWYIEELKEWRYFYNKENDKLLEIKRLLHLHRASTNKLGLKKSELEMMQKENGQEEAQSLEKQAAHLEQVTGKNNIDTKITSVKKWLEIIQIANRINEQRRKNG